MIQLDELHVVSDLHLGGAPGFQIFDQGEALAWLIDHVAGRDPRRRVALCLNGDVVDFLAADPAAYFDASGAAAKLRAIFEEPAFVPVWDALARFVKTEGRTLVVVLGNHDVELALPEVREALAQRLCGDDGAARGRILFAMDGTGFSCRVGHARVLCLHGNEADDWNVVDYDRLRKIALALALDRDPEAWEPNAGTRLVLDVMNDIKRRYAWVDLLKPEIELVPGLLAAVAPEQIRKLRELAPILVRRAAAGVKKKGFFDAFDGGYLSPADEAGAIDDDAALNALLAKSFSSVEAGGGDDGGYLGFGGAVWDRIRGRSPVENVREALRAWIGTDVTFAPTAPDDVFDAIDELVGPSIEFTVAGHTHLQRALLRNRAPGAYFNTGTWVRLVLIGEEMLATPEAFEPVWRVLEDGRMAALDDPRLVGHSDLRLVKRVRSVVSVVREADAVVGRLRTVEGDAEGWHLRDVEHATFARRG